jgi:hypothetical protein
VSPVASSPVEQLSLGLVFYPVTVTPQGDGSVLCRPGKPVSLLKTQEVSKTLRVAQRSIQHACQRGWIPAVRATGSTRGAWRIPANEIDAVKRFYGIPGKPGQ